MIYTDIKLAEKANSSPTDDYSFKNGSSNKRAIIIGSGIAGLMAAKVWALHFDEVLILERDAIHEYPSHRKGVPQDQQLHVLLAKAYQFSQAHFPNVEEKLINRVAIQGDIDELLNWYQEGGVST